MKKSGNPLSATEFNYPSPSVKNKNQDSVSFSQPHAMGGNVDPIKGAGVDNFTPISAKSNSPVRGEGYANGAFAARGEAPRTSVSHGK